MNLEAALREIERQGEINDYRPEQVASLKAIITALVCGEEPKKERGLEEKINDYSGRLIELAERAGGTAKYVKCPQVAIDLSQIATEHFKERVNSLGPYFRADDMVCIREALFGKEGERG